MTTATAATLAGVAPRYFAAEEFAVITKDQVTGSEFAKLPFDHAFFTGSPQVGASVAQDAAANLAPVTLELGGKNPVIVDIDADITAAAQGVADGRMANGGQVCMCPDYAFVPAGRCDEFVEGVLTRWKANNPTLATNDEYTSVIDDKNFARIVDLIGDAKALGVTVHRMVPPGEEPDDPVTRKIAPTVLTDATEDTGVESDEIFGPVLVVHTYDKLGEAIDYISARPHPLTLYWFGPDNRRFQQVQNRTRSGSVNANDTMLTVISSKLPLGGVGRSGMGNYQGRNGFITLSHARSVVYSALPISLAQLASAPFAGRETKLFDFQLRRSRLRNKISRRRSGT